MTPSPESLVFSLAEEYLQARESGTPIDRAAFLTRHPDVAPALGRCLDALDHVGSLAPAVAPRPGATLGEYRLIAEIGRGGMGVVYEAEEPALGRRVAVKVLPFAAALDPQQRQRFDNEARAAAGLAHPHIVPVHAVGEADGVPFFAMRLIAGLPLSLWLREEALPWQAGRTRAEAVAAVGRQAAEALDHAHRQGVLHRDVKPANLLVEAAGHAWVVDFGLARVEGADPLTASDALAGTPRYASPEQVAGRPLDHRTDQYSLAATLYEALLRRPAVPGATREEVLRHVLQGEIAAPRTIDPTVPRPLEAILLKALAREPADRYATCQELADDLGRFLAGEPVRARLPGVGAAVARWAWRRRVVLGAALAALVAGLGVAVAVLLVKNEEVRLAEGEAREAQGRAEDALAAERLARYQQGVGLAWREWQVGNAARARQLLADCPEAARGWEWNYLRRAFSLELAVWADAPSAERTGGPAFSPDGSVLARKQAGKVTLHDPRDGKALREVPVGPGEVLLAVGPAGRTLLLAQDDSRPREKQVSRSVAALDVDTGKRVVVYTQDAPHSVTWASCIGDRFAFLAGRCLRVVTPGSGRPAEEVPQVQAAVPYPPGRLLLLTTTGAVESYELEGGKRQALFAAVAKSHELALSPDGDTVVVADFGCRLWRWSLKTGRQAAVPIDLPARLQMRTWTAQYHLGLDLAFLDKDRLVVRLQGRREAFVLHAARGDVERTLTGHAQPVHSVASSADGSRLATADAGETRLWDVAEPAPMRYTIRVDVLRLSFDPDGTLRLHSDARRAVGDSAAVDWPNKTRFPTPEKVQVGTGPGGRSIVWYPRDRTVAVLDEGGDRVAERKGTAPMATVAGSSDGGLIAVRFKDGTAEIWSGTDLEPLRRLEGARRGTGPVVFSPDGSRLAITREAPSGSELALFDTATGDDLLALPLPGVVVALAWSRDGRIAVALGDNTIRFLDGSPAAGR